jgi:four helix bundle protein
MVLAEDIYRLVKAFPADERYGLTSQLRRAAVSVPSCIAEGNARGSIPDYLRFVSMAAGSLAEIQTQVLLAQRLGLGHVDDRQRCLDQHGNVAKLLMGLQTGLRRAQANVATHRPSLFPVPRSRP